MVCRSTTALLLLCAVVVVDGKLLLAHREDPESPDEGFKGYQQMGVSEEGRVEGGGCINWDEAAMKDQGKDGIIEESMTLDECAKKCKATDGCIEFMHCSGSECPNTGTEEAPINQMNFCGLAKSHCFTRPNMKHQWMTYRFMPDCDADLEQPEGTSDYVCPRGELKNDMQKGYYRSLHCTIINGNLLYHGTGDKTFAENWMRWYHKEMECLFATYLDDTQEGGPCGGLPSQFDSRKAKWEKICLSPGKAAVDVFGILDEAEKKYWFKVKNMMRESQAFSTLIDLVGDKQLLCLQIKLIDDSCGAFRKPRMMSPMEVKKYLKPPKKTKDICRGVKFQAAKGGPCGYDEEEEAEPHVGHP